MAEVDVTSKNNTIDRLFKDVDEILPMMYSHVNVTVWMLSYCAISCPAIPYDHSVMLSMQAMSIGADLFETWYSHTHCVDHSFFP